MPAKQTVEEALEKYVQKRSPDECWPAAGGGFNKRGWHVAWKCGGRNVLAHRAAWAQAFGDPGELFVLHKCDNPKCCNPKHLFLGTQADNARDMWAKGRARIPASHSGRKLGPSPSRRMTRESVQLAVERYLRGDTQKEIAAGLGVTDVALGLVFRGKTYPELADVVAPIQHLLGRGNTKGASACGS